MPSQTRSQGLLAGLFPARQKALGTRLKCKVIGRTSHLYFKPTETHTLSSAGILELVCAVMHGDSTGHEKFNGSLSVVKCKPTARQQLVENFAICLTYMMGPRRTKSQAREHMSSRACDVMLFWF